MMATERRKLYWVWWEMHRRCCDPHSKNFANYGGRGISVSDEWDEFDRFVADMGPRPKGFSVERLDNYLGYSASNCKWADRKEQNSNRRSCIYVTVGSDRVTLKEACRRVDLPYRPVHKRIMARGWEIERALSTPIGKGNTHASA